MILKKVDGKEIEVDEVDFNNWKDDVRCKILATLDSDEINEIIAEMFVEGYADSSHKAAIEVARSIAEELSC